jgi:hypothetical protein
VSRADFYTTAAQVIPVIWLALVFESRVLEKRRTRLGTLVEAGGMYSLVLGEIAAFTVLASGHDTDAALTFVIYGLALGGAALGYEVVLHIGYVVGESFERVAPSRLKRHGTNAAFVTMIFCLVVVPAVIVALLR